MSTCAWQNPEIIHINKQEPRSSFIPYPTVAAAKAGMRGFNPMYLSQNGSWNFQYFEKGDCPGPAWRYPWR